MAFTAQAGFTEGNLMRHVTVMSLTASIGLMAIFIVDLVDIYFISLLGHKALASAAGYASSVMFFASAINIGLSIAAAALVARALGAGDAEDARRLASSVAVLTLATGIIVPIVFLMNLDHLLGFLGASGEIANLAATYLWIILPSTVISGLGMTGVAVLRAHGDGKGAMYPALIGGVVNAIADPILIFSFDLGLPGAAAATVLARLVTMALALWLAQRGYRAFGPVRPSEMRRDLRAAALIAIPAVLTNIATPVGAAIVTREMARFGTEAVAGLAVINRITPVAFAVVLALSGAIGPIIGQNYGAAKPARVRETFWDAMAFLAIYIIVAALLLFALRDVIAGAFDATGTAYALIAIFCGPLALMSFFNGAIFVANATFNNLGRPGYSTWINWGRHTLGTWPLAILGAAWWGAPGVLIGQAIGGAIFAGLAVVLALRVMGGTAGIRLRAPQLCPKQSRLHVLCSRANR